MQRTSNGRDSGPNLRLFVDYERELTMQRSAMASAILGLSALQPSARSSLRRVPLADGMAGSVILPIAIPVVFGFALAVNLMFGYTINRFTLFALILCSRGDFGDLRRRGGMEDNAGCFP